MPAARSVLAGSHSPEVTLDLGELSSRVSELSSSGAGREYGSETVSTAIVMQARELHSCQEQGLGPELGPQIAELLCGVVQFATLCQVDIVAATKDHLRVEGERRAKERPRLREV